MFCHQVPGAVCLTCEEWGPESGLVTAAMKLKRRPLQVSIFVCVQLFIFVSVQLFIFVRCKCLGEVSRRHQPHVRKLIEDQSKFKDWWEQLENWRKNGIFVSQLFFSVDLRCAKVIGADQSVKEFSVNKDQTKQILLPQISLQRVKSVQPEKYLLSTAPLTGCPTHLLD